MSSETKNNSLVLSELPNGQFHYNRFTHPYAEQLCSALSTAYTDGQMKWKVYCSLACSGMNAIDQTIHTVLKQNIRAVTDGLVNIISSNELYCDTPRLLQGYAQDWGCRYEQFNPTDSKECLQLFQRLQSKETVNILFLESCSNPSGYIFDFRIIPDLRKLCKKLVVIVDNTWLSSAIFNPFKHVSSVDFVVLSLTKYYSAGSCIAGAILTLNGKLHEQVFNVGKHSGVHVSPIYCRMILDNLSSLKERICASSATTLQVIQSMVNCLSNIKHPSLKNHPSYELAKLYFNNNTKGEKLYPSIFTFSQALSRTESLHWAMKTGIDVKTSFGSKHSRFCNFPKRIDDTHTQARLSIGYEDKAEDIVSSLSKNTIEI